MLKFCFLKAFCILGNCDALLQEIESFMYFYGEKPSPQQLQQQDPACCSCFFAFCNPAKEWCCKYGQLVLVELAEWFGWFHMKRETDLFPKCVPAVCPKVVSFCGPFASLIPRRTGIFTSSVELASRRERKEAQDDESLQSPQHEANLY
jgi:hypothetical protein